MKPVVVVTGMNGQLGWELQQLVASFPAFDFLFTDRSLLDLSSPASIPDFFKKHKAEYVINCAAYTAVDKAETERELAYTINAKAVGVLAATCKEMNATLIHVSTDYVFNGMGADGNRSVPYESNSPIDPVNYYGATKAAGEQLALANNDQTIIIRTSWVYSTHGNNFVKTMLRLMSSRQQLNVVADQQGSPTYAADLANALLQIISQYELGNKHYGIYQYSNVGIISWYDFAIAIRGGAKLNCEVLPITTDQYPTPAKRPAFSGMNTRAITDDFGIELKAWKDSLDNCLGLLV
jgi:dTDP-4-dehydrorhamnose reductase